MASNESLILDSLDLSTGNYTLESLDLTPPSKRFEWITGGDSDGAVLARDALYDTRTITAQVRVEPQSTMDLALAAVATIVDKLQETSKTPTGIALTWTPADG